MPGERHPPLRELAPDDRLALRTTTDAPLPQRQGCGKTGEARTRDRDVGALREPAPPRPPRPLRGAAHNRASITRSYLDVEVHEEVERLGDRRFPISVMLKSVPYGYFTCGGSAVKKLPAEPKMLDGSVE